MRFSILIPVYNVEKYLEECLNSVLSQSFTDYEIVLVDDGSTDSSGAICDRYASKHADKIRVVHKENGGQLSARCTGIRSSYGEYCLFLDADDKFVDNALKKIDAALQSNDNPDMAVFPFYYDFGKSLERSKMLCSSDRLFDEHDINEIHEAFFGGTLLNSVCTKAVRRDVAEISTEDYEQYASLRCAEDRYQSLMMLKASKRILYISSPFYKYRIAEGSMTRQFTVDAIDRFNTSILYEAELSCLREWGMNSEKERFDASWIRYMLYVLDLFYNKVKKEDRKEVLKYPWERFIPKEINIGDVFLSKHISNTSAELYDYIKSKSYQKIKYYFAKKKIYAKLKKIKRSIMKKQK